MILAKPKSQSFAWGMPLSDVRRTFSGLRSQWTMSRLCKYCSAIRIWGRRRREGEGRERKKRQGRKKKERGRRDEGGKRRREIGERKEKKREEGERGEGMMKKERLRC